MEDEVKKSLSLEDAEYDLELLPGWFNAEADANAALPPVPAGRYNATFGFQLDESGNRWTKNVWGKGKPNAQTVSYATVVATLQNTPGGLHDGRQIRSIVSTYIQQGTGTCKVQGLLQCIGVDVPPACKTRGQLVKLLDDEMGADNSRSGEIEVEWEASQALDAEERGKWKKLGKKPFRLMGMKRFPVDPEDSAKRLPVINHDGEDCPARNIISRFVTREDRRVGEVHKIETVSAEEKLGHTPGTQSREPQFDTAGKGMPPKGLSDRLARGAAGPPIGAKSR